MTSGSTSSRGLSVDLTKARVSFPTRLAAVALAAALLPSAFAQAAGLSDGPARTLTVKGIKPAAFVARAVAAGVRAEAVEKALAALARHAGEIRKPRYLTLIDLAAHSSLKRMFVFDLRTGRTQALLVAHGRGSDPDHDGFADRFSNAFNSKMSSLGAYVTGRPYYGKHGLSLRLFGLDATNDHAIERAIVMHGADYVAPDREVLGRSWGCPAIERRQAKRLIPLLAGGSFLYITN